MKNEKLCYLIDEYKRGRKDKDVLADIVCECDGAMNFVCNRLKQEKLFNNCFTYEDAYQTCYFALISCLDNFMRDRESDFINYFITSAYYYCLKQFKCTVEKVYIPSNKQSDIRFEYLSLDDVVCYEFDDEDTVFVEDVISDEGPGVELIAEYNDISNTLGKIVSELPMRESYVVSARCSTDYSLEAIGMRFGVYPERVRQIEAKAIRSIRRRCYREVITDYCNSDFSKIRTESGLINNVYYLKNKDSVIASFDILTGEVSVFNRSLLPAELTNVHWSDTMLKWLVDRVEIDCELYKEISSNYYNSISDTHKYFLMFLEFMKYDCRLNDGYWCTQEKDRGYNTICFITER